MTALLRRFIPAASVLFVLFGFAATALPQCPQPAVYIPNFNEVGRTSSSWSLSWDAPAGAPVNAVYEFLLQTSASYCTVFSASATIATTTARTYTAPLTSNRAYHVLVRLQSDHCVFTPTTWFTDTFTSLPSKPAAPVASVSGSSVTLTLSYVDDRTWYAWVNRTGADGVTKSVGYVDSCNSGSKSWVDKNVPAGTWSYYVHTFNAAGNSDSATVTVTVGSLVQPSVLSFAATPPTIRAGQSAVLSFVTQDATSVTIDHGVGAQPLSGSVSVAPTATTTYTLTAMNGGQTATSSVTVNVITAPSVAVSSYAAAMVQLAGSGGATTSYTLTNAGGAATTVALSQTGIFFTQSPASFTLAPGASQLITVLGVAQAAGVYEASSLITGAGVPSNLQVAIKLLSTAPPSGTVKAAPVANRVDVAGAAGTSSSGTVSFVNSGSATLNGVLASDVPWLIPQSGVVTITPAATGTFNFTIDRSKRSDADAPVGSAFGRLSIAYLSGTGGSSVLRSLAGPTPTVSIVSVVDTVQPAVGSSGAPALAAGEIALFIPGVGHVAGSVGTFISDISILNAPGNRAITDLRFFYLPLGGSLVGQKSATLPAISVATVALADVVKNVFGIDSQIGSLQLRSADAAKLGVNATIFNVSNAAGTYGSSIPIFRSDRSVAQGGQLVLSGVRRTTTSHTNVFIQETSGLGVTVNTEFLAAEGSSLGGRSDTVGPFVLTQLNNVVPAGAVAAILTNVSTNGGKFQAYATPVDEASGDTWSVADWSCHYGYGATATTIIPVAGVVHGANNTFFRTDVALTNSGSAQASGTLRYVSRSGTAADRQITLGARQSNVISDVVGSQFNVTTDDIGYLLFTPVTGTFALTSRTYTTVAGQPATFGSGVPAVAVANVLKPGSVRAIGSIEDSSRATIVEARPGTFRTNFGLVETSGNPATVRVTVRYQYPAGTLATAVGTAFKDYNLSPNQFVQINGLMSDILGQTTRDTLGDLRGIEVDFQVISTTGAVAFFTSSIDNGSGDSTLRTE